MADALNQLVAPTGQPSMTGGPPSQPSPPAAPNIALVCRLGDETVQEIVAKTGELFQALRAMPPPSGPQQQLINAQERQVRTKELLKTIEFFFKRLRKSYEKCNECLSAMDFIQIESVVPMKADGQDCGGHGNINNSNKLDDKKQSNPKAKQLETEHQDLVDLLLLKNRQIKEIIDNLRAIVWEINTMLAMRRP
ncbi:mediator of RNA polymerase II transcription subunit 30-like [Oppia nitens]|uniref:mediator of RNA polymerase II transcription subunit 30-like n=1 Tax=Oppia nitens TaxID=1686743 RepID=UPI0023DAB1C4|nr:mediator of RNA polymerase II transcription subunit 30-like [Oppia nitens]